MQITITFSVGGSVYLIWAIYNLIMMNNNIDILEISLVKIAATIFFAIPLILTLKTKKQFTNKIRIWISISAIITSISEIVEYSFSINATGTAIDNGIPFIIFFIMFYYVLVPNKSTITIITMWFMSFIYTVNVFYLSDELYLANILIICYFIMVNFVGYGILITRNKLERKDFVLRIQLENEIKQRKKAEDNAKKAQKLAEISNKAKSQFLAVINHEMRTPLNIILGGAEILTQNNIKKNQQETISLIKNSGEHLKGLIQNILDFTSLEANKMEIIKERFSLKQHLDNICFIYNKIICKKNLAFNYNIEDIPESIISDPIRLKQILINLLNNAYKFCEKGSISLNVYKKSDTLLRFEIIDTGIGISKNHFNKILKPFSQVEQSSTRRFGGSGLGLTICNELLNAMDSKLKIHSEERKGSKFYFDLPVKIVSDPISETEESDLPIYKILVVDDTIANLKIIGGLLEILKQQVSYADSSKTAILISNKEMFDILLIDFHMPEQDGITTALEIKKANKDIKTFLMTADTRVEIVEQCSIAGFNDFIPKPISLSQLKKSINNIETRRNFPTKESLKTEVIQHIKDKDLLIDKEFFTQLQTDLGIEKFVKVITSCIDSLSEIQIFLKTISDKKEISEVLHRLKGLSGNYRLTQLYNFIDSLEKKDILIERFKLIDLAQKSIIALKDYC